MTATPTYGADCKTCRRRTEHQRIEPVSRSMDYFRCCACGTVCHVPKPQKERPS
jgi:hypothetical protein